MSNSLKRFQQKEITIDGIKFIIHPFGALKALKLKTTLIRHLSPAVGKVFSGIKADPNNPMNSDFSLDKIGEAIEHLVSHITDEQFINLVMKLLENVTCIAEVDGQPTQLYLNKNEDFEIVFAQKLSLIYKVISEVLKVNYPDFFGLVGSFGSQIKTVMSNLQSGSSKK